MADLPLDERWVGSVLNLVGDMAVPQTVRHEIGVLSSRVIGRRPACPS
ncbi:hypothetical protein OG217_06550 [Streptomyces sp. NBC_01023]|nr:hypothetical protein OG217_06550 [Streptomyces sp. NBC_01023]